jgi:hypothetical protein
VRRNPEPDHKPFTSEELREIFIGVPSGLWAIVRRENGRPYVIAVAPDETTASDFASSLGAHVLRKPPEQETASAVPKAPPAKETGTGG